MLTAENVAYRYHCNFTISDPTQIEEDVERYVETGEAKCPALFTTIPGPNFILFRLNMGEHPAICEGLNCDECMFSEFDSEGNNSPCHKRIAEYILTLIRESRKDAN